MLTFDSAPTIYWLIGYTLAGLLILASLYKGLSSRVYFVLAIGLLIFMRMPVIMFNREINPDESQVLSHAITLYEDPVYWRSVDGTTIGPLNNYLLVVPKLLGFQINYSSGRVMGLICVIGALLFTFLALKNWLNDSVARISLTATVLFLSFTQETDFVHYSSEQLPVFLLALIIWLLSKITDERNPSTGFLYLIGFFAGVTPFAKLQTVPQAMVVVVVASWVCFQYFKRTGRTQPLIGLLIGGITFPALLLIWTLANHVFNDFIDFYILGNAIYAGENNWLSIPKQFFQLVALSPDFLAYTILLLIPMLAGLAYMFLSKKSNGQESNRFLIPLMTLLLILTGIYSATKSGNTFIHYLNFCIYPWILLSAYGISRQPKTFLAVPTLLLLWFLVTDAKAYSAEHRLNSFESVGGNTKLYESPVVKALKPFTKPGDYLVVWGWQCQYYVEAQLPQGTAENHSERSIFKHPLQAKYLHRYITDLQRTKPAVFLDAVGKHSLWVQDKKTQGVDNFPAIAQYLHQHYTLVSDIDDIKLFVRNDRLKTPLPAGALLNHAVTNR